MASEALTAEEIAGVVLEARPRLEGRTLRTVGSVKPGVLLLELEGERDGLRLLAAAAPPRPRLHLTRVKSAGPPLPEARRLEEELAGSVLLGISAVDGDRVALLRFRAPGGAEKTLRLELFPRNPNWVLTDAEGTILALGRLAEKGRRILRVGGPDAPPPPVKPSIARAAAPRFPAPDGALSLSAAVERLFDELDARDELDAARAALTAEIEAGVRIRRARIEGLRARLELARGADDLQHRADLLSAARGRVPRGAAEVRLVDYFDPAMPEITVPLDPAVPFETHVERLYARLRRLRSGVEKTRAELGRAESELAILTDARVEAGACQDLDCCAALRARLERARHLTPRRKPAPARPAPAEPFRRFRSRDGLEILVGKGARENEALTFAHARGNDLWLHAGGGVAGSHVVVRLARGASAPLETLLDAAALAVHFSKARGAGRADVVYTLRKFVAKPRGARSGSVAITGETHLSIDLDRARLDRLLSAHRPEIEDSPEPPCPPDG